MSTTVRKLTAGILMLMFMAADGGRKYQTPENGGLITVHRD